MYSLRKRLQYFPFSLNTISEYSSLTLELQRTTNVAFYFKDSSTWERVISPICFKLYRYRHKVHSVNFLLSLIGGNSFLLKNCNRKHIYSYIKNIRVSFLLLYTVLYWRYREILSKRKKGWPVMDVNVAKIEHSVKREPLYYISLEQMLTEGTSCEVVIKFTGKLNINKTSGLFKNQYIDSNGDSQ